MAAGPLYPQDPGKPLEEDGSDPGGHLAVAGVAPVVKVEDGDGDGGGGGDDDHDAREVDADQGGGGGGRLHRRYLEESRQVGGITGLLPNALSLFCHWPHLIHVKSEGHQHGDLQRDLLPRLGRDAESEDRQGSYCNGGQIVVRR